MHERYEFRIVEEFANLLFASDEGNKLGSGLIRLVQLNSSDPRLKAIDQLQIKLNNESGRAFFHGWRIIRTYSKAELLQAKHLHLFITAVAGTAGEESGTAYDDLTACRSCGSGAEQTSALRLDPKNIPKSKDIIRTIANEWIISSRLAGWLADANVTGYQLALLQNVSGSCSPPADLQDSFEGREILRAAAAEGFPHPGGKFWIWLNRTHNREMLERVRRVIELQDTESLDSQKRPLPFFQLQVLEPHYQIASETRVGSSPFDEVLTDSSRCPTGDLLGLSLLTELSIVGATRSDADISCSSRFVGVRKGLLRPGRVITISQKFYDILDSYGAKGFGTEVARVV